MNNQSNYSLGGDGDSGTDRAQGITKLAIFLAVAIFGTSAYANLPHAFGLSRDYRWVPPFDGRDLSMVDHLGGEHRSIAEALAAGRGFADPFREQTGPTAWMAPALPMIQALFMALGGINLAVIAVVLLQDISLAFTGWLVLRAAARCRWPQARVVGAVLYFATTWANFYTSYQFTHDVWLIMLLVGALVYMADRLWTSPPGRRAATCWGLIGGVAMLSSPALGPVWLALTALLARASRRVRPFLLSSLVAAAVMAPWVARNAIVFGRFIPVKSNLPFEVYQSNVLEPDGVLRDQTRRTHPFEDPGTERSRYRSLGEMAYLDEYRARSLEAIRRDPSGFLERVRNRLLAATLVYHSFTGDEGKRRVFLRALILPLPFLGLVVVLVTRAWSRSHLMIIAMIAYPVYLMPYVIVAYYRRYAMPLLGLQVMFEIWALDAIWSRWVHRARGGGRSAPTALGSLESFPSE
jgi:hypothetical protein